LLHNDSQICLLRQELLQRQLAKFVPKLSQEETQLFLASSENKFGFFLQKLPLTTDQSSVLDISSLSKTQQSLICNKKSSWSAWKPYLSPFSPSDISLTSGDYQDWILAIAEEFPDRSELLEFARKSALHGTVHHTVIRDLMFFSRGNSPLGPTHQIKTLPGLRHIRSETEFAKLHEIATFNVYRTYRDQQLARKIGRTPKQLGKLQDKQRITPLSSFDIKVLQLRGLIFSTSKKIAKHAVNKICKKSISL
jgi:hypothetical protein